MTTLGYISVAIAMLVIGTLVWCMYIDNYTDKTFYWHDDDDDEDW